jgi:predicted kinase
MREQQGFIRECHGDLHAGNVVRLNRRLVPFDCLEFDPKLRFIDPINDLAFLAMDLMSQQRTDLAFALLSRYLEVSGDYEALRLLPFYAVYRALVRAKVDALSAMQLRERRGEFLGRMLRRLHAASTWIDRKTPTLILMHGPSGSGKSWLSERLVPALNAVRVRSDVERKRLAGVADTQSATTKLPEGCHSPEFNARTYSHVTDCASHCLRAGFTTIVDAASLDAADRKKFRTLAARLSVRYLIVSCVAPPAVLAQRVACRTLANNDASDADAAILQHQLHDFQSIAGDEARHAVCIDTQRHDAIDRVRAAYGRLQSAV